MTEPEFGWITLYYKYSRHLFFANPELYISCTQTCAKDNPCFQWGTILAGLGLKKVKLAI